MMASVLFIITIPTEAEENRLKQDSLAKKCDTHKESSDNVSASITSSMTKLDETKTIPTAPIVTTITTTTTNDNVTTATATATTAALTTTVTNAAAALSNILPLENYNIKDIDAISDKTITDNIYDNDSLTLSNAPILNSLQCKTLSKCKLTENTIKSIDDYSTNLSKRHSTAGSLKDIGFMDTVKTDVISSSSIKRKLSKKKSESFELCETTCMEQVIKTLLKKFQIQNAIWTKDSKGCIYQIFFPISFDEIYEKLLEDLNDWGIGDREGSTVTVMNCVNCKTFTTKEDDNEQQDYNDDHLAQKQGTWDRFMNSVRSRLNVAQIVRDVRQNAAITFDFVVLLVSAAILASFGLVEDSTIFLASSMLISPLMGPIIAVIFGTVIKDPSLGKLGVKNELFGIAVAIIVGFTFGLIICTTDERYGTGEGLTTEMLSRCELHSLLVGLFTAIASGAAAAIGILGGNIGSLVGVAISASLLPPAVNSGVLWSLAVIYKIYENDQTRYNNVVKSTTYSSNQATELAILGTISMCLTISNVFCIYIMGILVLRIKEIAPVISRDNRQFWKHDIKIARDLKPSDIEADIAIMDEFAKLPENDQTNLNINYNILRKMHSLDETSYQNTWSPLGTQKYYDTNYDLINQNYSTIHPIDRLYSTITNQKPSKDKRRVFSLGKKSGNRFGDLSSYYKLISENKPHSSNLPSKVGIRPFSTIITPNATITAQSTTSGVSKYTTRSLTPTTDEHKRRKFIVTPADDPLQPSCTSDDVDV